MASRRSYPIIIVRNMCDFSENNNHTVARKAIMSAKAKLAVNNPFDIVTTIFDP